MEFNQNNFAELARTTEELKKLNAKLVESEQLKSQFLSNIRNEINNPITSILGLSQTLKQPEKLAAEDIRKLAGMIFSEASYLSLQMKTIFAAADLEGGELFAEISTVRVNDLVEQVISDFSRSAAEQNIKLEFQNYLSPGENEFKTDAEKVTLILNCLIANSIEFSAPGKTVTIIATADENGNLHFTVKDEGAGINPADQERVFDRFVQLDSGTNKRFRGLGLGLSVAKSLVELLGGEINLTSAPGKGSEFEIILPQNLYDEQMAEDVFDDEGLWDYDEAAIDSEN